MSSWPIWVEHCPSQLPSTFLPSLCGVSWGCKFQGKICPLALQTEIAFSHRFRISSLEHFVLLSSKRKNHFIISVNNNILHAQPFAMWMLRG